MDNITDSENNKTYFDDYQNLDVHHVMLMDTPRNSAYKNAIFNMKDKFADKIVMDVGAGTGILSVFCAQAGAKKVYAVEACNLAKLIPEVAEENKVKDVIEVIEKRVEDINPQDIEKVDIIVSEWMGFYLLHEGMLDSVIFARDTFLKPDGLIFPSSASIYAAPCQLNKYFEFWDDISGISMKCIAKHYRNSISKPQVLIVPKDDILSKEKLLVWVDLNSVTVEELNTLVSEESIVVATKDGKYQGLAIWFDVVFPDGSILDTSPEENPTHWKQTVIVLPTAIDINKNEPIAFQLKFMKDDLNPRWYKVEFEMFDAADVEHDIPCDCYMTKCIVTKTYIDSQDTKSDVVEK